MGVSRVATGWPPDREPRGSEVASPGSPTLYGLSANPNWINLRAESEICSCSRPIWRRWPV